MRKPKYEPLKMGNPKHANEYGRKMKKYLASIKKPCPACNTYSGIYRGNNRLERCGVCNQKTN